jgi:hypothetical protein
MPGRPHLERGTTPTLEEAAGAYGAGLARSSSSLRSLQRAPLLLSETRYGVAWAQAGYNTHWGCRVATWIYFASETKASLASTLGTIVDTQFLWRSARNAKGALIANVANIVVGDSLIVAWRDTGRRRTAYLRCRVAAPEQALEPGLIVERLSGPDATELIAAGYPESSPGTVDGFRVDEIVECSFAVQGEYGGNNALHRIAPVDVAGLENSRPIPPNALREPTPRVKTTPTPSGSKPSVENPAIDTLDIHAKGGVRAFDAYFMVDWSSSSSPVRGNDSIWIARGAWQGPLFSAGAPINVSTRVEAIALLTAQLTQWVAEEKRVLVGLDFAFGYPSGFAAALGLPASAQPWRAIHEYFAANVTDSPTNAHNRDAFAEACNSKIGAPGPFWGCSGPGSATLTKQRVGHFTFPHQGLAEWRLTDLEARRQVTTQSVWKLNCGVSVGGQTILGVKHLEHLAKATGAHRWPFEGWSTPSAPGVCLAEIFPSLILYPEWESHYRAHRDRTQVQSCLRRAAERDNAGMLQADFAAPVQRLDSSRLARVQAEEGWILWL